MGGAGTLSVEDCRTRLSELTCIELLQGKDGYCVGQRVWDDGRTITIQMMGGKCSVIGGVIGYRRSYCIDVGEITSLEAGREGVLAEISGRLRTGSALRIFILEDGRVVAGIA